VAVWLCKRAKWNECLQTIARGDLNFSPSRLLAMGRCGLLLQMSHVALSVCVFVRWAKTAEPRCMSVGRLTHAGPGNDVLDGWGPDPRREATLLMVGGHVSSHCNVPRHERIAPAACECACSAHAADEYITFDTCYPHLL